MNYFKKCRPKPNCFVTAVLRGNRKYDLSSDLAPYLNKNAISYSLEDGV